MGLVEYSDSEDEADPNPTKKQKVEDVSVPSELPPLPPSFLDQYSSTVRTSIQDNPALHGGRKRVTPHVEGNWPTHVFLEWRPDIKETHLLSQLVAAAQISSPNENLSHDKPEDTRKDTNDEGVHSLLDNDLGVPLPLHISLSRPLVLKTAHKDAFLARMTQAVGASGIKGFDVHPKDLMWHPNETRTCWFLVIRLQASPNRELRQLLDVCNAIAHDFGQPLLYASDKDSGIAADQHKYHISIAWSLYAPRSSDLSKKGVSGSDCDHQSMTGIPYHLLGNLSALTIGFSELKVRIGQDVHAVVLRPRR